MGGASFWGASGSPGLVSPRTTKFCGRRKVGWSRAAARGPVLGGQLGVSQLGVVGHIGGVHACPDRAVLGVGGPPPVQCTSPARLETGRRRLAQQSGMPPTKRRRKQDSGTGREAKAEGQVAGAFLVAAHMLAKKAQKARLGWGGSPRPWSRFLDVPLYGPQAAHRVFRFRPALRAASVELSCLLVGSIACTFARQHLHDHKAESFGF